MSNDVDTIREDLENSKKVAEKNYENQLMAAKQPAIVALQKGLITLEQYAELVGETFASTMQTQYTRQVSAAGDAIRTRVDSGLLTEDEYTAIVGHE